MSFKYLVKEKIIIYKYILNRRSTTHSKINSLKLRLRNVNCNFDKTKSTKIKIYFRRKNKYPTGKNQIGTDSVTRQIEYISVHSNIYLLWNWFFKTKPNIHQRRDLNIALSSFLSVSLWIDLCHDDTYRLYLWKLSENVCKETALFTTLTFLTFQVLFLNLDLLL